MYVCRRVWSSATGSRSSSACVDRTASSKLTAPDYSHRSGNSRSAVNFIRHKRQTSAAGAVTCMGARSIFFTGVGNRESWNESPPAGSSRGTTAAEKLRGTKIWAPTPGRGQVERPWLLGTVNRPIRLTPYFQFSLLWIIIGSLVLPGMFVNIMTLLIWECNRYLVAVLWLWSLVAVRAS